MVPVTYSVDGYEETFATNCLGHFLLIELLVNRMESHRRIVLRRAEPTTPTRSMEGWSGQPLNPTGALANDGKEGKKPLPSGVRYSTPKLCNILYAYEQAPEAFVWRDRGKWGTGFERK